METNQNSAQAGSAQPAKEAKPPKEPSTRKPRAGKKATVTTKIVTRLEAPKVLKSFREETTKSIAAAQTLYKCMRVAAVAGHAEETKQLLEQVVELLGRLRHTHRQLNHLLRRTRLARVLDWPELVGLAELANRATKEMAATGTTSMVLTPKQWKALFVLCFFLLQVDEAPVLDHATNGGNES